MVTLKILFITTLLGIFTYYFGWQSFKLYAARNVMFTDERKDVDKDKPPALMIAYTPSSPKNAEIIGSCLNGNKSNETKGYEEAVDCIDKNLRDITRILRDHESSQKILCSQTQIQKGLSFVLTLK